MNDPPKAAPLTRPCELCGALQGVELSSSGRGGASFRTVVCPECGLVFSDPFPHDVREFYEKSYRLDYKGAYIPKLKHVLRAGLVALDRHRRLGAYFRPGARLLDIGSGGGEFIYLMRRLGLAAKGVEPNLGYAEYSRESLGLDVSVGFIQDAAFPPASFDVMTIWHVLEHTEAPGAVLRSLAPMLSEGGSMIVEVPNIKAACQSPGGTFHVAHLYNFSASTLSGLMAKSGLAPKASFLSPDGGNLTVIASPAASGQGQGGGPAPSDLGYDGPGEAAEGSRLSGGRSALGYLLSPWPWRRAWGRLGRSVRERRLLTAAAGGAGGRRQILDDLYAKAISAQGEGA